MNKCAQTKNWSVSLFGDTLPKYLLYGKVNGKVYTCDIFTARVEIGRGRHYYNIKVRDDKRARWITTTTKQHGDIFLAITQFLRENNVEGTQIEVCHHKTAAKHDAFYRAKAAEFRHARIIDRELDEAGRPREKRNVISASGAAKHTFMREGGRIETEYVWVDEKNPNAFPVRFDAEERGNMFYTRFEQGQNTCGEAGRYTRSGFEVKRDGLKIDPTKVKHEKPDYMRRNGQPNGVKFEDLRVNKFGAYAEANRAPKVEGICQPAIKEY